MASQDEGQGTVQPHGAFSAEKDCEILRKAMKGIGTDEKAIIDVLANRNNAQRQQIKLMFKTMYGKDLIKELKSELGGNFEDAVIAVMMTPIEFDAHELRSAMSGAGTDENALIEIMCTRTNKQITEIKAFYKLTFHKDLEKDLMSETSGHFRRLLVSMCAAGRMENQPVSADKAKQDAQALYNAGEKQWGTDESVFNRILASQSAAQLRAVFHEYHNLSKKTIEQSIGSEMSGDVEKGLLAIVKSVQNRHLYFAERLHSSMRGAGTKDRTLVRVIVSRSEIDLVQIKNEFQRAYGKSLQQFVQDDVSGDYRRFLLSLIK